MSMIMAIMIDSYFYNNSCLYNNNNNNNSYVFTRLRSKALGCAVHRRRGNMVGVNMVRFSPCLKSMYSARTMFTPTMFSHRRCAALCRAAQRFATYAYVYVVPLAMFWAMKGMGPVMIF